MKFDYPITITVRRVVRDPRTGDPLPNPAVHQIPGCAFDPGTTDELSTLGTTTRSSPRVFGPYDADVLSSDEVLIPGDLDVWQVDGEVKRYRNPFVAERTWDGCEIPLSRQRG